MFTLLTCTFEVFTTYCQ